MLIEGNLNVPMSCLVGPLQFTPAMASGEGHSEQSAVCFREDCLCALLTIGDSRGEKI